jgi:hypothetical protein
MLQFIFFQHHTCYTATMIFDSISVHFSLYKTSQVNNSPLCKVAKLLIQQSEIRVYRPYSLHPQRFK